MALLSRGCSFCSVTAPPDFFVGGFVLRRRRWLLLSPLVMFRPFWVRGLRRLLVSFPLGSAGRRSPMFVYAAQERLITRCPPVPSLLGFAVAANVDLLVPDIVIR